MFILGTYVGIASTLFSAFVCWRCFSWRRRFPSATLAFCGALSAVALLWSGLATLTETALAQDDVLRRSIGHFKAGGDIPPEATLDEFRVRIHARNNSMILTNVALSFVVTALAGLLAMARFGRATTSKSDHVQAPPPASS